MHQLEITTKSTDGTLRCWQPIWVVCVDRQVYVRTWHRRTTGWYGQAVLTRTARVRLARDEVDVSVEALGDRAPTEAVNRAYVAKYGGGGTGGMLTDEAIAATLRLAPADPMARPPL